MSSDISVRDDGGAVGVMVAILLSLVLLGIGAVVLDLGNLSWERRMLQNSADAGAIAAAQDFAVGEAVAAAEGTARDYAELNNPRGAYVEEFLPEVSAGRVTVVARTGSSVGPGVLPSLLASAIGHDDYFARARAVAVWGAAGAAGGFPFGVCQAFWDTNRPVNGTPGPLVEVRYKGTGGDPAENDCLDPAYDNFNPGSVPGNFSWLATSGGECTTDYEFSGGSYSAGGDTGANLNADCRDDVDDIIAEIQAHKSSSPNPLPIRVLPIYSSVEGTGINATYELVTLGAFEFSGIKVSPQRNIVVAGWMDPLCSGGGANHLCVQGRFVQRVDLTGTVLPGFDSDVIAVQLVE